MFDTLSYSESLAKIGVPQEQVKLQAKLLSKAFESNDLATKADITELRSDVKLDITELRSDVKLDITELKADVKTRMAEMELRIIKWQIGGIGLVIAAIKFL